MNNYPKEPVIIFPLPIVTLETGYWKGGVMLINVGLKFLKLGGYLHLFLLRQEVGQARTGEILKVDNEIP
jgi:hypothetical protein